MKHINFKERWLETLIAIIGTILLISGWIFEKQHIFSSAIISIGCSLIASAVVSFVNNFYNEKENALKSWGVDKVYKARAEKSADSDPKLTTAKKHLDIVAFGLKSFRSGHKNEMIRCLQNGVDVRIITMSPESEFAKERAKEENETEDQIAHSVRDLVEWCKNVNREAKETSPKSGQIRIMAYKCMTLDFYWRCDNELYFGPYLLGKDSQQTVTFRAQKGGKLFEIYTEYFEELWKNDEYMEEISLVEEFK